MWSKPLTDQSIPKAKPCNANVPDHVHDDGENPFPLRETEIVASGRDCLVKLSAEDIVTLVLGKVKLCKERSGVSHTFAILKLVQERSTYG
jgi:hypothetical protein